jgi:UDP-N-acetylglucosamine:LPS N-acetylglucosamine transferase
LHPRVLILTAGYGEGHNTAARCLAAAFTHLRPDLAIEVADPYAACYGRFNDFVRRAYITAINKTPRLWQAIYWTMDRTPLVQHLQWLSHKMERWLALKLEQERPAIICSTFPAYNFTLARIHEGHRPFPYVQGTVITDSISINSLWTQGPSDVYYVPNEATARAVIAKGLEPDSVLPLGFPVQLAFALPERRLTPPAIEAGRVKILYILNSGKTHADAIVSGLLQHPALDLTLAVGRDSRLRERLETLIRGHEDRVTFIGWTDQMPQLMMTHHLLITKAGGATVQEALAAGIPLLLNQVVPGQEEGNWFLVRDHGCGDLAPEPAALLRRIRTVLADNAAELRRWRENLRQLHRPDAALRIAQDLLTRARL